MTVYLGIPLPKIAYIHSYCATTLILCHYGWPEPHLYCATMVLARTVHKHQCRTTLTLCHTFGQNRIYIGLAKTVYIINLMSLPNILYIHRKHMVLANPIYTPYTVPKFNHPAPQKKIFSFANPQPIRTPFNIYYNPIRRPFLSHSHQFRPFSPIRRPKIIYLIFCPHLAAPLKNIIFAG